MRLAVGLIVVVVGLFASAAPAQTTQPSQPPSKWEQTAATIADALTSESRDAVAINTLIPDNVAIQRFASRELESTYRLQQRTTGMAVVSVHGYTWPAERIASDLAADVKQCEALPAAIQKQFIPRDDADAKRANTTAAQWIAGMLQPAADELVAVIVLWEPQPLASNPAVANDTNPPEIHLPMFILIKAQRSGRANSDDFVVTQVAYGDLRQALN